MSISRVILILYRYAFPAARFGHDTNNITESINSLWGEIRELPPLLMVDAIHTFLMTKIYERYHRKQRQDRICNTPLDRFNDRLATSRRYQVFQSGNGIYQVQIPDTGTKRVVDLRERICECTNFEEYQSPCVHAIAACRYEAEDPYDLFIPEYTVKSYRSTYEHFILPVSIENLDLDTEIKPPEYRKTRGRPRVKRIRKGAWKRKATFCSNCLGTGHNKRTCREAPTVNGRRQRARDRARGSSSELSSASLPSSSSSSSSSSRETQERQAERQEEREYLMEMAEEQVEYELNQRKQRQDYTSDSELSMLASSLFNGIEGDEMDSVEASQNVCRVLMEVDSEVVGDYNLRGASEVLGGANEVSPLRTTRSGRRYGKGGL